MRVAVAAGSPARSSATVNCLVNMQALAAAAKPCDTGVSESNVADETRPVLPTMIRNETCATSSSALLGK